MQGSWGSVCVWKERERGEEGEGGTGRGVEDPCSRGEIAKKQTWIVPHPSSSTDEGSKSHMTVDTGSAMLAKIFVCQLSGAAIYLRGPQRTVANSSELHQNLSETLESRRTLTKLGECRQNLACMRVPGRLSANLRDPQRTFENLG